jgi:hypothetical protein
MEPAKIYRLNMQGITTNSAAALTDSSLSRQKPRLLDQVRQAIQRRHYSDKTEKAYIHWIKRYIFFHNKRHPGEMGEAEIGRFLTALATTLKVSASTQNQALNALLFLYKEVLNKQIGFVRRCTREASASLSGRANSAGNSVDSRASRRRRLAYGYAALRGGAAADGVSPIACERR